MDVKHSRRRRDRPIFVDIMLIGAVMAALLYGGLRLLSDTRVAWDARETRKTERAAQMQATAATAAAAARREQASATLDQVRLARARFEQDQARQKNRRCVGGVLFAEVDGVLTNVGRC